VPTNTPKHEKDIIWKSVSEPSELEETILQNNKKHFQQANGTPFTTAPLIDIFGPTGTNDAAEKLYQGIEPTLPEDVSDEVRMIIKKLATHRLPEFDSNIPL
jgi:hypothetical protein